MDMLPNDKNYVMVCEFHGGTGTKPIFSVVAEKAELFIDNYNGGKCGSMKEDILRVDEGRNFESTTPKEVQLDDQTLQGFFDLEGETF